MIIALINGSPKINESASGMILHVIREKLGDSHEYVTCDVAKFDKEQSLGSLKDCDALVFSFPLYVDGVPSHLLNFLDEIKDDIKAVAPNVTVWAIANNGFYEGHQNALALDMVQCFCHASGLKWGQGIGVGAGGMVGAAPIGNGPMKNLGMALDRIVENILNSNSDVNLFIVPNFPRFLYKMVAHIGWKRDAKKSGTKAINIYYKPV